MTIKTITTLKNDIEIVLADNTTGDISPSDVRQSIIDTIDTIESKHGWQYVDDTEYTVSSPLICNNAKVQITLNDLGSASNKAYLPDNIVSFWDTSTNSINPELVGDSFILRLDFKAKLQTLNGYGDVQLDISNNPANPIIISESTITFVKGINTEQRFNIPIPIFCLNTFEANNGRFYIDTRQDGARIDIYDIGLLLIRTSKDGIT